MKTLYIDRKGSNNGLRHFLGLSGLAPERKSHEIWRFFFNIWQPRTYLHFDGLMATHTDVSENNGTPKSSIFIGFSIINHPFWGTTILGNTHIFRTANLPIFHRVFGGPKASMKNQISVTNQQNTFKNNTWHGVLKSHWIEVSILATIGWLEHPQQFRLLYNHRRFRFQSDNFIEKRNVGISEFSNHFMI